MSSSAISNSAMPHSSHNSHNSHGRPGRPRYSARIDTRVVTALLAMPNAIIDRLIGAPPVQIDGRTLNRRVQLMMAMTAKLGMRLSIEEATAAQRRAELRKAAITAMPIREGVEVTNRSFPGPAGSVPIRLYRPFGHTDPMPAIVFYHGGGWAAGDLDTHDGPCRILAAESGCLVISVDYRLAPEHPFPAAVDDALAAYRWVHHHTTELSVIPGRVGVMGDSAGGNLSAVVAQQMRKADVPEPIAQCLVYPATDMYFTEPSHDLFAEGFFLERSSMEWYREQYLPDIADWDDPRATPIKAANLSGVAPAFVVTAGFDPLRDEGRLYAERLTEAEVPVRYRCYDDMVHGFFGMGVLPDGLERITEICVTMGEMMHEPR
ncbi:MAG: alpha/beta hydrolase [Microthrixaceae bacterium]